MAVIAAAHDLSGVGRCSLVAAISIISAAGHTCYPLPTAILSQQTAFPGFTYLDFTPHVEGYLAGWEEIGVAPDLIFTGFLGSAAQPEAIARYIDLHPGARVVIDPVMGDDGEIYPCYDSAFVRSMERLIRTAHILTPNPTELSLMAFGTTDTPLPEEEEALLAIADRVAAPRLEQIVLTGNRRGDLVENVILDRQARKVTRIPCIHTGVSYGGSGDMFSSVLCSGLAGGLYLADVVRIAGEFLTTVAKSMPESGDPRLGMRYEPYLAGLAHMLKGVDSTC